MSPKTGEEKAVNLGFMIITFRTRSENPLLSNGGRRIMFVRLSEIRRKNAHSTTPRKKTTQKQTEITTRSTYGSPSNKSSDTFLKFSPILVDSVASTLRILKACKATGLDKIPAKILKLSANIIAPSLTFIFNLSLATGIYIDEWKQARVTPIFKSGDRRQCENYRPISVLPVVSKVFEKEVFRQLYSYLTENSLLSKFESGFRPKHSTVTALIQMCDEWLENMDNGKLTITFC